jgi:flavin reductase (DIM6/NTAB) family NADH-FMN oxidoreductase RutF
MTTRDESADNASDDAYDRLRRRVLWSMPSGLYVVGSRGNGEGGTVALNLMTANLVIQVCVEPKLIGVAIDAESVTHGLMIQGGVFAISLLPRTERTVVRKFVKPITSSDIGRDERGFVTTMAGQAVHLGQTGAPLLAVAAAGLECEIRQRQDLGSHSLFIGEVVAVVGPDHDVELLRMEDTRMNYGG